MTAIAPNPAYGYNKVHFVKEQTTFDTHIAMAATDGFRCMDMKLTPSKTYEDRGEGVNSQTEQERIPGKRGGKFSAKFHLMPTTAGTAPDAGPFFKAAFGTETTGAYTLSATGVPLQLSQCVVGSLWEEGSGACVEQLDIECASGTAPTVTASGSYARHIWAGRGSSSGVASGQTVIPITSGQDGLWSVDSYVDLVGSGNTNRQVTAVTAATPSITIGSSLTTTIAADGLITPYCPTPTIAGNYIPVGVHSLTIDSMTLGFISAKISLKTGFHLGDKESTTDRANRIFCGKRTCTFEIQFYYLDGLSNAVMIGKAWDAKLHDIDLRIGENTTAKRCLISIPAGMLDITPLEIPAAEEMVWTAKGTAIMYAATNDELALSFT
jgi:hypothetical protein